MKNEEKVDEETQETSEEETKEESIETKESEESTDWQEEAYKLRGQLKRALTKIEKSKEVKAESPEKKGFDYAELAYLSAKGISDEDISFVEENVKNTGKSLKDLLVAKWFQAELQERKEAQAAKDAIPTGSKRSTISPRSEVDYWIAKGELPPADQTELRRKVLKAREDKEGDASKFTSTPVIGG